jgi:hypothetical protein
MKRVERCLGEIQHLIQTVVLLEVILKPHCIRCSHFKVDDVSALEASSNRSVRVVEDNVTTSQCHCIGNVRRDPGYGLDAVTT